MTMFTIFAGAMALVASSMPTFAAETQTYTYDARGRLVKVVRTGSVNNGVTTEITHDRADNRARVKVSGASH